MCGFCFLFFSWASADQVFPFLQRKEVNPFFDSSFKLLTENKQQKEQFVRCMYFRMCTWTTKLFFSDSEKEKEKKKKKIK